MRTLLACILLLAIHIGVRAQNELRFNNYEIQQGLSQSFIADIGQDLHGYMWFATQDGLNRFDGYDFETFEPNTNLKSWSTDVTSIHIEEDTMIIGTNRGLLAMSLNTYEFKEIVKANFQFAVNYIIPVEGGHLIGTERSGVFFYNKAKQRIVDIDINAKAGNFIRAIETFNNRVYICSEDKGLSVIDPVSLKLERIAEKEIRNAFAIEKFDTLLVVGTQDGILFLHGKENLTSHAPIIDNTIGKSVVSEMKLINRTLWIGTQGQGLWSYTRDENGEIVSQNNEMGINATSLVNNYVEEIFIDFSNNLWVGTQGGISKLDLDKLGFKLITIDSDPSKGLIDEQVWSFAELGNELYIGTRNYLSILNRDSLEFEHFKMPDVGYDKKVLSIYPADSLNVYVGTSVGLFKLNRITKRFRRIVYDKATPNERVYSILPHGNGLLLGTFTGLCYYDLKLRKLTSYKEEFPGVLFNSGPIRKVFRGKLKKTYLLSEKTGLVQLYGSGDSLNFFPLFQAPPPEIVDSRVMSVFESEEGVFWFGTYGKGVVKYDAGLETYETFSQEQGLTNTVVYGILGDKWNLWLSTNQGLFRFNIKTKTFKNYEELDGLQSNEFNAGAYFKSREGELYFGGIKGFNSFYPNDIKTNKIAPRIVINSVRVFNKDVQNILSGGMAINTNINRLELNYDQNNISITISPIHYSKPQKNQFKYKLDGAGGSFITLTGKQTINLTGLSPGEYTLIIRGSNGDGYWQNSEKRVQIVITPPFWESPWFLTPLLILLAIGLYIFFRRRIDRIRRQKVRLELTIVERTREIRAQKQEIEDQKRQVELQKEKIEQQKKIIEKEKEKVEGLLLNILPEQTARELKEKGKAKARYFQQASILFTDFVGFTAHSEKLEPKELVEMLDGYFKVFDEIIEKHHLDRIKTIGDAYMAAGGIPIRNKENPIHTVLSALAIKEYIIVENKLRVSQDLDPWNLRIGINTGEVIAGVIGTKRFAYDIWGHSVNLAQRMEMHGTPNQVNISENTHEVIKPYFICTSNGKIATKHKGEVEMYIVHGIKPELSIDGEGKEPNQEFWKIVELHLYNSINYVKAEKHIVKLLEERLSPKLYYHSIEHTLDVVRSAERIAIKEGVTDEGLFLLKSAATYHDAGFVEQYDANEPIGMRLAEEILPQYGYTDEHIEIISQLIRATIIPHAPENKLEEIICDADLDYLGRDDFHEIADKLRQELREMGKIDSDRLWDEIQVKFLTQHKYFTETSKRTRDAKKAKHLEEIKERLKTFKYKD